MEPNAADGELTSWLADHTDTDADQVAAELEMGARRRAFVVGELIEAGFEGAELLELVIQLTGIERVEAQALIAARFEIDREEARETAAPLRDRALAKNEILFRRLNERLASAERSGSGPHALDLLCECSDRDCLKVLTIESAEYDWLRQDPHRFAVLPGHEAPALEDVVERHDGFVIVEKHVETHEQVEAADPRS